jgi:septum formation protein
LAEIILASQSPRRKELLYHMGLDFEIISKNVPEDLIEEEPLEAAGKLALKKALAVAEDLSGEIVIGADTIVVLEGKILGKPDSFETAREMLAALSGRYHQVITGVAVVDSRSGKYQLEQETTGVYFRQLTDAMINSYVESGEPFDKAGAYGIQGKGGLFVTKLEGCYFNVVGLPISRLAVMLENYGFRVF